MAGDDVNLRTRTEDNDHFILKERIGAGAFSSVYLATEKVSCTVCL